MDRFKLYIRLGAFGIISVMFMLFSFGKLYDMQIVNGDKYLRQSERKIMRTVSVPASRGEILDRYGRPLVTNRVSYVITFDTSILMKSDVNDVLHRLIGVMDRFKLGYNDSLPITEGPYIYKTVTSQQQSRFDKFLAEKGLAGKSAEEVLRSLYESFGLMDSGYDDVMVRRIAGVRYELELRKVFTNIPAYEFANDVPIDAVVVIREQDFPGVMVETVPIRQYETDYAAHILGRVGPIYEEEYAELKAKGYAMNEYVGKDGMEKVLEDWLRGVGGLRTEETNKDGKVTNVIETLAPQPGKNCLLTIDIALQEVAERSLATNIQRLIAEGNERWGGFDAEGGSVVAIDVNSGEILAMASYPTFSLATFNRDYNSLIEDPLKPMVNRATMGTYEPGSVFKMVTSVAALESGVITPKTRIMDKGVYTYYAPSYTPACGLWRSSRQTHGNINVVDALRVSCNYFFYEVGRLTGIDPLDRFARLFGLGEPTGIELPEYTGIMSSPETSKQLGQQWYPGNVLSVSIGQLNNTFTPLQLANYTATLANGGTRYKAHLLKSVKSYDYSQTLLDVVPEATEKVDASDETIDAVLQGMRAVAKTGTASNVFGNYFVDVGAKTGSAQVTAQKSDNGVFVAFAPYDNPQIAVAVVVERGGQGNRVAPIARDIFDAYFSKTENLSGATQENTLLK